MISPQPAESACGHFLLGGQLERAAEGLHDCWSAPELDGQICPSLTDGQTGGVQRPVVSWTRGGHLNLSMTHLWTRLPLEDSSSIGCLKAVMSLKVHRNRTTLSCSFLIGAIFTKNHTGIPVWRTSVRWSEKCIMGNDLSGRCWMEKM